MARTIWNGSGEIRDDEVYFTDNAGAMVGRPYVRERVRRALTKWARIYSLGVRHNVLAETVDNDAWLAPKNGCTVGSVVRDAVNHMVINFRYDMGRGV